MSTVPTVDWVLLRSGESIKGLACGSLYLQLVCKTVLASRQDKHVNGDYMHGALCFAAKTAGY